MRTPITRRQEQYLTPHSTRNISAISARNHTRILTLELTRPPTCGAGDKLVIRIGISLLTARRKFSARDLIEVGGIWRRGLRKIGDILRIATNLGRRSRALFT